MRIKVLSKLLYCEGNLDESTSPAQLNSSLLQIITTEGEGPIIADLSNVSRANSSGVLTWLKFIRGANLQFKYVNAPVWLVGQFNIVTGYFEHHSFVESFFAPYYSESTRSSKNLLLKIGTDFLIQQQYPSTFKFPVRIVDDLEYEIDFDPGRYLKFIEKNYENFKKYIV